MRTDGQHFDVVIVGGGLAGNCLALALSKINLKTAIVEVASREQLINSALGDRALALAAGSVNTLDTLGVWQGIKEKATAIKAIHVSDRGYFGKVRLSAQKLDVEALGYVITARDIEKHVAELVDKTAATQINSARLVELTQTDKVVNLRILHQDESLHLSTQLLVGADGGNSSVRQLLNIPQNISEYGQTALVTTVECSLAHQNVAYERFTESGPLALLPATNKQCSVVWTRSNEDADSLMKSGENDFCAALQSCFGYKLGKLKLVAPIRAFPVSLIQAERMHIGRAVILGNAAHTLHPVAGQGFNLGLRDIEQFASMVLNQYKQGDDMGVANFLNEYATKREKDHRHTIAFTHSLVRLFSTGLLPITAARNVGLIALDHAPFAKALLSKHAMGLAQRLTSLAD